MGFRKVIPHWPIMGSTNTFMGLSIIFKDSKAFNQGGVEQVTTII